MKYYAQSIVFGNGWQMTFHFSDVQVILAEPIYPTGGTLLPGPESVTARSA